MLLARKSVCRREFRSVQHATNPSLAKRVANRLDGISEETEVVRSQAQAAAAVNPSVTKIRRWLPIVQVRLSCDSSLKSPQQTKAIQAAVTAAPNRRATNHML